MGVAEKARMRRKSSVPSISLITKSVMIRSAGWSECFCNASRAPVASTTVCPLIRNVCAIIMRTPSSSSVIKIRAIQRRQQLIGATGNAPLCIESVKPAERWFLVSANDLSARRPATWLDVTKKSVTGGCNTPKPAEVAADGTAFVARFSIPQRTVTQTRRPSARRRRQQKETS